LEFKGTHKKSTGNKNKKSSEEVDFGAVIDLNSDVERVMEDLDREIKAASADKRNASEDKSTMVKFYGTAAVRRE
jgi:hypothetical protein